MMSKFIVALVVSLLTFDLRSASPSFRGLAPQDEHLYKTSSEFIKCKQGSGRFKNTQLNDDFCDCPDGTDEPGTSACPNGRFYCRNAGHSPKLIFSSRVDDAICDCCDGSDESSGLCPNTCWQAGQAARDKLRNKISTFEQGVSLRNQLIQQAKAALAKDNAELADLKSQEKTLKSLVNHLKEQKDELDKADEKERLRKEEEEEEKQKKEPDAEKIGTFDHSSSDQQVPEVEPDTNESPTQAPTQENDASESTEELSREELGRLVASRWTGENADKKTEDVNIEKDNNHENNEDNHHEDIEDDHHEDIEETTKDLHHHEEDAYASETDDDRHHYDDDAADDFKEEDPLDSTSSYRYESDAEPEPSDTTNPSDPSFLDKIQQKFRSIIRAVNLFQTPVNQSDAAHIRKEYDESSGKLSKMQSKISSLTQKLKHDFGPDKEFYSFYDKCFENKEGKYVYKVCPYKHASQEEGHSSTRLGRWDKFEESYKVMIFSNGDKCWNGPDRSLTVKLRCGLKNEVADVDEPSRCEYVALLSTPTVCFEEKLKELQRKLDEMNKDQPEKHDEL